MLVDSTLQSSGAGKSIRTKLKTVYYQMFVGFFLELVISFKKIQSLSQHHFTSKVFFFNNLQNSQLKKTFYSLIGRSLIIIGLRPIINAKHNYALHH